MSSPSNALNISDLGLVFFDGIKTFTGKTLISSDNTITITVGATTIDLQASDTGDVQTLTGNTGVATPIGGTINVVTSNATVTFVGSAGNLVQDFDLTTNLVLGSSLPSLAGGNSNVGLGRDVLNSTTAGSFNVAVGLQAMLNNLTASACTAVGYQSLLSITQSGNNTGIGTSALFSFTGPGAVTGGNTAVGAGCLSSLVDGIFNTCLGDGTAINYVASESSNIIIGNVGVVGESNVIRIGTQGTANKQQDRCFLAGILNTVSGRVIKLTTPGAYPYTALTTDYMILVDTSAARTINLMATPTTGTQLVIKDNVGSAEANIITVTPNAGNIDGAASYQINTNYGSITIVYNGTQWNVI